MMLSHERCWLLNHCISCQSDGTSVSLVDIATFEQPDKAVSLAHSPSCTLSAEQRMIELVMMTVQGVPFTCMIVTAL